MSFDSSKEGIQEAGSNLLKCLIYASLFISCGGIIYVKSKIKGNPFYLDKFSKSHRNNLIKDSLLSLLVSGSISALLASYIHWSFFIILWIAIQYLVATLMIRFSPDVLELGVPKRITEKLLKNKISNTHFLENQLINPNKAPIGVSFTTGKAVHVPAHLRNEHLLITGSTGSRKSSAAISLRRSDFFHNRAVIDIDPKGDKEDVETIKDFAKLYDREDDFLHFNISDPINSFGYDPLEIGSKRSKVDKVIYALDLRHEHYAGIAEDFISLIFDVCDFTDTKLNIGLLTDLMLSKENLYSFFETVHECEEGSLKENLIKRITSIKSLKSEDLKGIKSKLSSLGSFDLRRIFNPETSRKIDLLDVVKSKKIAFFQLNSMEFHGLNRVLSRFILSDLQIIASMLGSGDIELEKDDFVAVYLEEALTVIDKEFPHYLRMVRSSNIALTMVIQTFAKLTTEFGPTFKSEIMNETKTSLHFESGSDIDTETITLVPGTMKIMQQSSALDNTRFFGYSGRGTESESEVKRVESNILRKLKKGQCLYFDRGRQIYDVIEAWSAKEPNLIPKTKLSLLNNELKPGCNELISYPKLTLDEQALSRINSRDWHRFLNYSDIETAKNARIKFQKTHLFLTKPVEYN